MGMFDSIIVTGSCQTCGRDLTPIEIQTKIGDRQLENWTIGSKTTLPDGYLTEDFWCWECFYEFPTEEELVANALVDKPRAVSYHGDRAAFHKNRYPVQHAKLYVKDSVLLSVKHLRMCPGCIGQHNIPPIRSQCGMCAGRGFLDEVVEVAEACPNRVRSSPFENVTSASMKRGLKFLKSLGKKK